MRTVRVLVFVAMVGLVLVSTAAAFRFTDASRLMPSGVVGQPYSHGLDTAGGCKGVEIEVLTGSLPPGLQLTGSVNDDAEGSNYRIEGTPTAAGNFGFWLQARNICARGEPCDGNGDCTQEPFGIGIAPGLTIENASLPGGTVGQTYSVKLTATGGGSQTWSLASGTLPAGLAFAADGTLSGTPTAATTTPAELAVQVSDGSGRSTTKSFALIVIAPLELRSPTGIPSAEVGRPYVLALQQATGGIGPYTYTVDSLPDGLSFDPTKLALIGTPTAPGASSIKISVTDNAGTTRSIDYSLTVVSQLEIVTRTLRAARVNRPYTARIVSRGGLGEPTWKLISVRPRASLRFDPATATLMWTPRVARPLVVTVRVTGQSGARAQETFKITVQRALAKKKKKTKTS